ncbi:hypothetical protein niasHT_039319 [Heterodera trifolii]|uniref:Uncharacterized protein n=1 Tax=Heterodera trifolii TaxID=157864 RepID=A0ABD2IX21_9BILA
MIAAVIFNKTAQCHFLCDLLFFKGLGYFVLESSVLSELNACESENKRRRKKEKDFLRIGGNDRLVKLPLSCDALQRVPFFDSLILVVNYSVFAFFVFLISDAFCLLFPESKAVNTSAIWVVGALILQIHIITKISLQKLAASELLTERNTLLCASALFFLLAITFCAFSDKIVDLNFDQGYSQFVVSLDHFLLANGFGHLFSSDFHSPLMLMLSLSLLYALVASAMFFPLLQFSSLYIHSDECSVSFRFLLHFAFFAPFLIVLLFLRPISDHLIENDFLSFAQLRMLRFVSVLFWVILRIAIAKVILQTFLNRPKMQMTDYAKDSKENRQRKVAFFASYVCVTSLQYILPVLATLSTALLLKCFDRFATGETEHQTILNVILNYKLQEPIWNFSLILLLSTQFFVGLIGIIGERSF